MLLINCISDSYNHLSTNKIIILKFMSKNKMGKLSVLKVLVEFHYKWECTIVIL